MKETLVRMLQLGSILHLKDMKTAPYQFSETIVIPILSRRAADEIIAKFLSLLC